ncbi:MAG: hypothetical protein ACRDH6_02010 [Actinomycetota bacterium]
MPEEAPTRGAAFLRLGLAFALIVSVLTISVVARADHQNGTYSGNVTGGGTVQFTVQGDMVTTFQASNIPCDGGGTGGGTISNMQITNHSFGMQGTEIWPHGTFQPGGRATGAVRVLANNCSSNFDDWEVMLSSPPPSPSPTQEPCRCTDVNLKIQRPRVSAFDSRGPPAGGYKSFSIEVTKEVICEGQLGGCKAKVSMEVDGLDPPFGVPKQDRVVKCKTDICKNLMKKFSYRIRFPLSWFKRSGKIRKLHGRYKIEDCMPGTTTFIPFILAFDGRSFDPSKSDLGNRP